MSSAELHIVQGGVENGDKKWLEKAARRNLTAGCWVAPKSVAVGDEVVVFIGGYGFFATARINSTSKPRDDRPNRYGAELCSIKLIRPAISLAIIQKRIPQLKWANYPRSIATPSPENAERIRDLIRSRRSIGIRDLDDQVLEAANIDELREAALLKARRFATPRERKAIERVRSRSIRLYVLRRANGFCEACCTRAPFCKPDGSDYLEPHHTTRLSDEGPDHPAKVIGLCPNCHRKAHYAEDARAFNAMLVKKLRKLEGKATFRRSTVTKQG